MLRRAACLLILVLMSAITVHAQRVPETFTRQPRILLLLDGSSSMLQPWGTNSIRFKAAAKVAELNLTALSVAVLDPAGHLINCWNTAVAQAAHSSRTPEGLCGRS